MISHASLFLLCSVMRYLGYHKLAFLYNQNFDLLNLGTFGRWSFAEFTAVFEIEAEFAALIDTFVAQPA